MRLIDRVRERRLRRCKPSAAFVEDELAMGLLMVTRGSPAA